MPRKKEESKENKEKKTSISEAEFEKKVIELAEKGMTAEKIGEHLRSQKIHPKEHKKISRILKEKGNYVNPDIKNLEEKLQKIKIHLQKNKQDKKTIRESVRIAAKIRRLKKHFE